MEKFDMAAVGTSRRSFLGGLASFGALSGCSSMAVGGDRPLLKFGVVSDVHVQLATDGVSFVKGYDTETLEKTFTYFRDQGVDAVVIAGDIADRGLTRELKAMADTWFEWPVPAMRLATPVAASHWRTVCSVPPV